MSLDFRYNYFPAPAFIPAESGYERYMDVLMELPTEELLKRYYELLEERAEAAAQRRERESWAAISHRISEDLIEIAAELRKRYIVQTFDWVNNEKYMEQVRTAFESAGDCEISVGSSRLRFAGKCVTVTVTVPRLQKMMIKREVMRRILSGDHRDFRGIKWISDQD